MATTVTLTSSSDANLSRSLAYESDNTHVREASFSSYLSSAEETFILKLAEFTRNPSPTTAGPQEPASHYQISIGRKEKADGEINVFGAERYFNGGMDDYTPRVVKKIAAKQQQQQKRDEHSNLHFMEPKIKHGTPSTCSELSGNSRSALLPSFLRDQSPYKQNRSQAKRFFATFGCNCSCANKKSTGVEEDVGEIKVSRNCKSDDGYGRFHGKEMITKEPTKSHQTPIDLVGIGVKQNQFREDMLCEKIDQMGLSLVEVEEEEYKKSLDVFGSPVRNLKLNQERGLGVPRWEGVPRIKDNPVKSGNCGIRIYDDLDMESDASSDLFEIESFSGTTNRCLTRQTSDGMSCLTPTIYEPSEASIDWSVVTASAANFSTISDQDERGSVSSALKTPGLISNSTTTTTRTMTETTSTPAKQRSTSILSGCMNQKAVKVAADAYKMSPKESNPNTRRRQGLSDSFVPITRFQAETKAIDMESSNRNWGAFTPRSLPQSKLAHASHLLYMS